MPLSRRRSSARNVPSGEERGETDVFAGYMQSTFVLDPPSPGISIINFQGMPVTPFATILWNFCQGLQILLISGVSVTSASQI